MKCTYCDNDAEVKVLHQELRYDSAGPWQQPHTVAIPMCAACFGSRRIAGEIEERWLYSFLYRAGANGTELEKYGQSDAREKVWYLK